MTSRHKRSPRSGLSYVERFILGVITDRAKAGRSAPSHSLLQDALADVGVFVGADKIGGAEARLISLNIVQIEQSEAAHVYHRRFLVVSLGLWTGWTDNKDRRSGQYTIRNCIIPRCRKAFRSSGPGHRMCPNCRASVEASPMDFSYLSSAYRVTQR